MLTEPYGPALRRQGGKRWTACPTGLWYGHQIPCKGRKKEGKLMRAHDAQSRPSKTPDGRPGR